MTDRYAKMKYECYRMGHLEGRDEQSTGAQATASGARIGEDTADAMPAPLDDEKPGEISPNPSEKVVRLKYDAPASSIDTSRLPDVFEAAKSSVAPSKLSKTMTVHTSRLKEPPLPKFEDGKNHTTCQFCFQVIGQSLVRKKESGAMEWSDEGR